MVISWSAQHSKEGGRESNNGPGTVTCSITFIGFMNTTDPATRVRPNQMLYVTTTSFQNILLSGNTKEQ